MGTDTTTSGTAALAGDVHDTARRPPALATAPATAADARRVGTAR